ncbi:MAG TPA: DUF1573 domain-containing protein [Flavipsychrobacter sp.]|nr:DUF1573 domain-containing protein [Flavipsychrobacter sp.]
MKKYFLAISILCLAACNNSGNTRDTHGLDSNALPTSLISNAHTASGIDTAEMDKLPSMDFKDTLHDFGSIHEGETIEYDFDFVNNGKSPLLISGATGSCGCTVADYPQDPIQPGKGGTIKVKFNSTGKSGHQEKSVEVNSNSKYGLKTLYIKGEVLSKNNNS